MCPLERTPSNRVLGSRIRPHFVGSRYYANELNLKVHFFCRNSLNTLWVIELCMCQLVEACTTCTYTCSRAEGKAGEGSQRASSWCRCPWISIRRNQRLVTVETVGVLYHITWLRYDPGHSCCIVEEMVLRDGGRGAGVWPRIKLRLLFVSWHVIQGWAKVCNIART